MWSPLEEESKIQKTESEEGLKEKRCRRVSFAENTSVHIYHPDQTPPDDLGLDTDDDDSEPPSASSNDEDNFFGPVKPSFIRQGLSDSASAMSDDNHDQTMDSTAFSMHYRSVARSDSEDLKTLTRGNLSFEEKTPTPGPRSTMQLTLESKPDPQPHVSVSKSSTTSHLNDMSLVGEYHDKYDYGKLSPAMDPLIAVDHDDMLSVSHITVQNTKAL